MFAKYGKEFAINAFAWAFTFIIFGAIFGAWIILPEYPELLFPIGLIYIFIVSYQTHKEIITKEKRELETTYTDEVNQYRGELGQIKKHLQNVESEADRRTKLAESKEELWKRTLLERASGFPTLLEYLAEFDKKLDDHLSGRLRSKAHPALKSAQVVKEEAKRRRESEKELRRVKAIIEYYENIAPFLLDFKDQLIEERDEEFLRGYTDEEKEDPVSQYLAVEEYKKLTPTERNQRALDRFWKRPKSKWLLGRLYERYVGYLYEKDGYDVEYVGIFKGYEDLGRDLICSKGREVIVIQCKNWSRFKTIFEKHIFQFFGTVFEYRDNFPRKNVKAVFYTTTEVSDLARRFAVALNIKLKENFKFDQGYPCIKCNISRVDGGRIYHLPFDQQYDTTKVETKRGEFYCSTVEEAERAGFRRAFRWKGNQAA